jgi:hypothetical protein
VFPAATALIRWADVMYQADQDRVREIESAPRPDVGAPLPAVVANEDDILLAYIVSEPDPNWDGSYVDVVSSSSPDERIAIVRFVDAYAHVFEPPNDEAFSGHPLSSRGLRPYSVSMVDHSSWLRSLERMNSVHPYHRPEGFSKYHHYIFAFHDSTFECIAEDLSFKLHRGSMRSAVELMAATLGRPDTGL